MNPSPLKAEAATARSGPHILSSLRASPHPSPHSVNLKAPESPESPTFNHIRKNSLSPRGASPCQQDTAVGSLSPSSCEDNELNPRHHDRSDIANVGGSSGSYHVEAGGLVSTDVQEDASDAASFRDIDEEEEMLGNESLPDDEDDGPLMSAERSGASAPEGNTAGSEKTELKGLEVARPPNSDVEPYFTGDKSDEDIVDDDDNDDDDVKMKEEEDFEESMECESGIPMPSKQTFPCDFNESPSHDESQISVKKNNEFQVLNRRESSSHDHPGDDALSHSETQEFALTNLQSNTSRGSANSSYCSDEEVQYIDDEDVEDDDDKENDLIVVSNLQRVRNGDDRDIDEPRDEENIEDDEEDDDQVECADCNKVFVNLQAYMDHTCYRPKQSNEDGLSPQEAFNYTKDAENFRGDIVYTPSGSAYILEAGSIDPDRELSLTPEAIVVREGQSLLSMSQPLPRIENAVFVPRRQSLSPTRIDFQRRSLPQDSRGTTSFNVFDLMSTPADALLTYFPSSVSDDEESPKPVLMCFICKFSFGFHKSFLRHALSDHAIRMSNAEELLVCRPTVSAIIHTSGKEKLPSVSILKAVSSASLGKTQRSPKSGSMSNPVTMGEDCYSSSKPGSDNPFSPNQKRNNVFSWARDSSKHSQAGNELRPSVISEAGRMSIAHSPTPMSMNGMRVDLDACSGRRRSPHGSNPHESGYGGPSTPSSTPPSSSNPKTLMNHVRSRSPTSLQRRSDSPSDSHLVTASTSSDVGLSGMPSLIMMSSASGAPHSSRSASHSIPSHLGLHHHAPPSSSVSSLGFPMHPFFPNGGCEEHGPGGARTGECAKCDLALAVSSSSLAQASMSASNGNGGGPSHMTLSHSRNSCKTLKCPKCNWHYKYQETLEIHMKEKHPDSDAQCVYCLTNQPHPRLARGESYSCGYKPYRCEVCNYSTTTKGNLSIHMQSDKHINNMQDLASGGVDIKMAPHHHHQSHQQHPHHQAPSTQSLPPSSGAHSVTVGSTASFPLGHEESPHSKLSKASSGGHSTGPHGGGGAASGGGSSNGGSKYKQTFRCDVCSYETSVARNLRIHMTSEKHTHNMLVMSQSMTQMQQDFTLHQMNQMNQFLALTSHQEQQAAAAAAAAARFAVLSNSRHPPPPHHLAAQMFPYDQAAALQIMSAAAASTSSPSSSTTASTNGSLSLPHPAQLQHGSAGGFDIPVNLTKDNVELPADPHHPMVTRVDAQKLFVCCVCNKFASDSLENIHNHIQYDRTKMGNSDTQVTFNNGTYHCNLCTYKTHLKANFQLHCKTDKHLQKLQLVNHILEGGPENEWRMANFITSIPPTNSSSSASSASSPMQICCNACGFYANSSHKMQLHVSTMQHESSAQLFKHLQLLDRATPSPASGNLRFYQCTVCPANFHTKQRLVLHARSPLHLRKEQALPLGQVSILSVFLIKEMKENESNDLEDSGKSYSSLQLLLL